MTTLQLPPITYVAHIFSSAGMRSFRLGYSLSVLSVWSRQHPAPHDSRSGKAVGTPEFARSTTPPETARFRIRLQLAPNASGVLDCNYTGACLAILISLFFVVKCVLQITGAGSCMIPRVSQKPTRSAVLLLCRLRDLYKWFNARV